MGRKSREKKLRAQMRGSGAVPDSRSRVSTRLKMSDLLLDVAQPLLDGVDPADDPTDYRSALLLAAVIWNASVPGSAEGGAPQLEDLLADICNPSRPAEAARVASQCREVMRRSRSLYPNETRIIVSVDADWGPNGKYHVNVASLDG